MSGRRLNRQGLRRPNAQTFDRLSAAFPVRNGLSVTPVPARLMRSTLPEGISRSCARKASFSKGDSGIQFMVESPIVTKRVPSGAGFTAPIECIVASAGSQSVLAAKCRHRWAGPLTPGAVAAMPATILPRIGVSTPSVVPLA